MSERSSSRKRGPLEDEEIKKVQEEQSLKRLSNQEEEKFRLKVSRSLFDLYYNYRRDEAAYLDDIDQRAYFDEISRLGRIHSPQFVEDEEIAMLLAVRYKADHVEEFMIINRAFEGRKERFLTQEQRELYGRVQKFSDLPQSERHRIQNKELEIGVEFLPPQKRDLYKRWLKNKYRGNWFAAVTGDIIALIGQGVIKGGTGASLLDRAYALKDKTSGGRKKKNTRADLTEGENLIGEVLEKLYSSIKGIEGDERKKKLQELLGVKEED